MDALSSSGNVKAALIGVCLAVVHVLARHSARLPPVHTFACSGHVKALLIRVGSGVVTELPGIATRRAIVNALTCGSNVQADLIPICRRVEDARGLSENNRDGRSDRDTHKEAPSEHTHSFSGPTSYPKAYASGRPPWCPLGQADASEMVSS